MQSAKYTEKQILNGLREYWRSRTGLGFGVDLDKRIDLRLVYANDANDLNEDDLDEICSLLPDLFSDLAKYFGFECPVEEWKKELGIQEPVRCLKKWEREIAPRFTFAALVRFIEKRAIPVLSQSVMIIDRKCRPAGVFYGFQQIINSAFNESNHFGPSTKIIDAFRGYKLEYFWSQLEWMTEKRIPKLSTFWRDIEVYLFGLYMLGLILVPISTAITLNSSYAIMVDFVMIIVAYFCFKYVVPFYKNKINPLPPGLVTFRDLTTLIATNDNGVAEKT